MLSIDEYNQAEINYLGNLSNRAIQAFTPTVFKAINYPIEIYNQLELVRYIDVMHDSATEEYYSGDVLFSDYEKKLIRQTCNHVLDISGKILGKGVKPWISPLDAVEMLRIISGLVSQNINSNVSILEIGPGSGYLGAYLLQEGYQYCSVENTQPFYLWQNLLFDTISNGNITELANHGEAMDKGSKNVHIPWWRFVDYNNLNDFVNEVDIVVCDHALVEIPEAALQFFLRKTQLLLQKSKIGTFVFKGLGGTQCSGATPISILFRELKQLGFKKIEFARCEIYTLEENFLKISELVTTIPMYLNRKENENLFIADEVIDIKRSESAPDYIFTREIGGLEPSQKVGRKHEIIKNLNTQVIQWQKLKSKVVIYGVGEHTDMLIRDSHIFTANIVAFMDSDLRKCDRYSWGHPVLSINDLSSIEVDIIVISSKFYQQEIYQVLKKIVPKSIELVRLYPLETNFTPTPYAHAV